MSKYHEALKFAMDSLPQFERSQQEITPEIENALGQLGWEDFDRISRRGELNRSVLTQKMETGEISPEGAERIILEDGLSYYINKLVTDFQVAEHDAIKQGFDSLSYGQKQERLNSMTPAPELKLKTYEHLKQQGMVL